MNAKANRQAVIDYLLSQLRNRLRGAVDFWTVVCLNPALNPTAFLAKQGTHLRALVEVIEAELPLADQAVSAAWKTVRSASDDWLRVFAALEHYESLTPDEIAVQCDELKRLYFLLDDSTRLVRRSLGLSEDDQPLALREHALRTLDALPTSFLAAQSTGRAAVP